MKTVKLWSSTLTSERAQINQTFCIKQKQNCFCHALEPEGGMKVVALFNTSEVYLLLLCEWDKLTVCLRVNACISFRVMCLSWLVFFSETVYI